jgi:phosphate-selective porin OprO/OprP
MRVRKVLWLAPVLAATVLSSGFTNAWSQETYTQRLPGVTYSQPATQPYMTASLADDASLGDRVAELEAALGKIKDKEAAAKKKAAGKPSVTVGGRLYADWYAYDQDAASVAQITDQQNGFRFDTVRIFVKGSAFHVVDYKLQFDFAGTQTAVTSVTPGPPAVGNTGSLQAATFKDVYITVKELPLLGHIKAGHYKEPFSLDQLTSSRFIMFMERSLADVFAPGRNVGVMAYDTLADENITWAIGAFISEIGDEPPIFKDDTNGTAVTMRTTWTPWYDEATGGRGLLHLGAAYSYRNIADGSVTYARKPEADLGSNLLTTGAITAITDVQLVGLEAALVYGPFRIQSEYMQAYVTRRGFANPQFDGAYVEATYFLTGEQRKYKRSAGTFSDRVVPFENFFRVRDQNGNVRTGRGAWQVAYRLSYLDLDGAGFNGGNATNHTFGLNWYLNPYTRLMFNYINSNLREGGTVGNMNIAATRFQIDF